MKIPNLLINRETITLYFAYCTAIKDLYRGSKNLFICAVLTVLYIPLVSLELLCRICRKWKNLKSRISKNDLR